MKVLDERTRKTLRRISALERPSAAMATLLPIAEKVQEMAERRKYSAHDLDKEFPEFGDAVHAVIADHERELHEIDRKLRVIHGDRNILLSEAARIQKQPTTTVDEKLRRIKRIVTILEEIAEMKERAENLERKRQEKTQKLSELFKRAPITYFIHVTRRGDENKVHPAITEALFRAIARRKGKMA